MRFFAGLGKLISRDIFLSRPRGRLSRHVAVRFSPLIGLRNLVRIVKDLIVVWRHGRIFCDSPSLCPTGLNPPRLSGIVELRGWALACEGIRAVRLNVDGQPFGIAHHGVRRRDLGWRFPYLRGASRSGFYLALDTRALAEGPHTFAVTAQTRSGGNLTITGHALVANSTTAYERWRKQTSPTAATLDWMRRNAPHFPLRPRISLYAALLTESDLARLPSTLASFRDQVYPHWELVLACADRLHGAAAQELERFADERAQIAAGSFTRAADAWNAASRHGTGEWFGLLDLGDELEPSALFELAYAINRRPQDDLAYSDEEMVRDETPILGAPPLLPVFKPDWSPNLLASFNYIGRLWVARNKLRGDELPFRPEFGSAAEYDMLLRLTEQADGIGHVPSVLVKRQKSPFALAEDARKALENALERRGEGEIVAGRLPHTWRVRRRFTEPNRVSIIFEGNSQSARWLLDSPGAIRREVLLVDDSAPDLAERLNQAAQAAQGDYLIFLRAEAAVDDDWIDALCEIGRRDDVAVVGGQLIDAAGRVHSAGLRLTDDNRLLAHVAEDGVENQPGALPLLGTDRDCSAVSRSCLLVRRHSFHELGGFDERLDGPLLAADFCLHARANDFSIISTPYARLRSATDAGEPQPSVRASEHYRARWFALHERGDPYFSPNFSTRRAGLSVNEEPTCLTHAPVPLLERGSIRRILAVKLDHIGDVVLSLPALRRLRQLVPAAEITFLVGPHARHIAEAEAVVDRVLTYEFFSASSFHPHENLTARVRQTIRDWLAGFGFDLAIDFRRELDTRDFVRLSGARHTVGFANLGEAEWLTVALPCEPVTPKLPPRRHMSQDPLRLVETLEQAMTPPAIQRQSHAKEIRHEARQIFAAALPTEAKLVVGIHPGSGRVIKCWPTQHFGRLARLLTERLGATVVLFAGPDEMDLAEQVRRHAGSATPVVSLAGKLSLGQMAVAAGLCDLFVGNDSGPTHLAAAAGVPVLGVYAGTADPMQWGPLGPNAAAIHRAMSCAPCYLSQIRQCPIGVPCMKELHPEKVFEAALRLLLPRWSKLPPVVPSVEGESRAGSSRPQSAKPRSSHLLETVP